MNSSTKKTAQTSTLPYSIVIELLLDVIEKRGVLLFESQCSSELFRLVSCSARDMCFQC